MANNCEKCKFRAQNNADFWPQHGLDDSQVERKRGWSSRVGESTNHHFDFVSNRILLDRESYDFGRPKWHLLETLKVLCKQSDQGRAPSTYRGLRLVYFYDDDSEFDVSRELQIDYYD